MRIISHRSIETHVSYRLFFEWADSRGAGFSFPCDENGKVNEVLQPAAQENLRKCLSNGFEGRQIHDRGIQRSESTHRVPAVGKCDCGRKVTLDSFTNTCDCGADYNMSGQCLAPREQWGEETGESWHDCY